MTGFTHDLRDGWRALRRSPIATLTIVATLALAIGGNSALFALVDGVLLKPLPLDAHARLVNIYTSRADGTGFGALSYPDFEDIAAADVFDGAVGYSGLMATLTGRGDAEILFGEIVTANYFSLLSITPIAGRGFLPDEGIAGAPRSVIVLGHAFWQRRFGGDVSIVGRALTLNGRPYTVVGIAPPGFSGLLFRGLSADLWAPAPVMGQLRTDQLRNRDERWMFVKARLADRTTIDRATAALATIGARLQQTYPTSNTGRQFRLKPHDAVLINPDADRAIVPAAALLTIAASLVLLIACTNIASVMLARGAARRGETAVRLALGASRARVCRALLAEAALVTSAAGALGLMLAQAGARALARFSPDLPVRLTFDVGVDARVVLFTTALTAGALVAVSALPALRTTDVPLMATIKDDGSSSRRRRAFGLRNALLIPQVAVSFALIVLAGLFGRSVARAGAVDPGFDLSRTAFVAFNLGMNGYDAARARTFYERLAEDLRADSSVEAAALTDRVPLDLYGSQSAEVTIDTAGEPIVVTLQAASVGEGFFDVMGIRAVRGRTFTVRDMDPAAPAVAVVSAETARRHWRSADPIGQRIRIGDDGPPVTVVGVAADVKVQTLGETPQPFIYQPLRTGHTRLLRLVVRTRTDPAAVLPRLRAAAASLDANVAVFETRTLTQALDTMLSPFRMASVVATAFGVFALMLGAIGLYGAAAATMAERRREIAIRSALGADPLRLVRTVIGDAAAASAIGFGVGLLAAAGVATLASGYVFGISAFDPLTFVSAGIVLVVAAGAACYAPARAAVRLDPMGVLRTN